MKMAFAALILVAAVPAVAQTNLAPVPVPVTPSPAPASAGKLSLDTPIETIVASPQGKAVLTADLGIDVTQHPAYESFKRMSLNQVAPMSGGKITDDQMKKLATDLAAIQ